jgi:hypothetical protein
LCIATTLPTGLFPEFRFNLWAVYFHVDRNSLGLCLAESPI